MIKIKRNKKSRKDKKCYKKIRKGLVGINKIDPIRISLVRCQPGQFVIIYKPCL